MGLLERGVLKIILIPFFIWQIEIHKHLQISYAFINITAYQQKKWLCIYISWFRLLLIDIILLRVFCISSRLAASSFNALTFCFCDCGLNIVSIGSSTIPSCSFKVSILPFVALYAASALFMPLNLCCFGVISVIMNWLSNFFCYFCILKVCLFLRSPTMRTWSIVRLYSC